MLTNIQTGSQVEVDIVIEAEMATIPMIVGIECTAVARTATVEWVREMYGKHQALPTDKLVLVSESGYSSEAEKQAQAYGVEAISLQEAVSFDWAQMINQLVNNPNLRIAKFQPIVDSWSIKFDPTEKARMTEKGQFSFNAGSEIVSTEGEVLGTVQLLAEYMLRDQNTIEQIMRGWIKQRKEEFTLTWQAHEGTQITDVEGEQYLILAIILKGHCEVESMPVDFKAAAYGKTQVAYAQVPDIFSGSTGDVTVLFTEQEGEDAKGWLGFSSNSGFGKQIFPANRPSTHYDSS